MFQYEGVIFLAQAQQFIRVRVLLSNVYEQPQMAFPPSRCFVVRVYHSL